MKKIRMRQAKKLSRQWTEYEVMPITCECGRKYKLIFRVCTTGKQVILDQPFLGKVGSNEKGLSEY